MLSIRRFASVASLFAFVALGTAGVAYATPEPPTQGEAQAAEGHGHHGHHGRGDLLRASLRLDSLSATQRQQIESLVSQEKATHANIASARSKLMTAVADRVVAGNVDDVALAPDVHAVEGAIQADEPSDRAALEQLHAILTPAQRVELVTKVQSHERHGARGPQGQGQGPNADAAAPRMERGEHGGMFGRGLNLTDAQKQQIATNLKSIGPSSVDRSVWKAERDSREHVLEAFKGDRFVMSEVAPPRDPRLVEQGVERMVRLAKASAPVLTPDQRTAAAAKLRAMAARGTK